MHKIFARQTRVDTNAVLRSGWIFWSVMMLCAIVTSYAYMLAKSQVDIRNNATFKSITDANLKALRVRIQSYSHSLDGAVGLIAASDNVTLSDWRHYTEALDIETTLPGIRGMGLVIAVPWGEEAQFIKMADADGLEGFQIHPKTLVGESFVIKYIEPLLGNREMVGFDLATEGDKRLAATKARETGLPTMTQHFDFSDDHLDHGHQPGFLLFRPFYTTGMPIDTVKQRLAASKGWIFAPFIGQHFLEGLTLNQEMKFHISVFDGTITNANTLIYNSESDEKVTQKTDYAIMEKIKVFGRDWTVTWRSTVEFDASHQSRIPSFVLLAGVLFSIIYTSIIGALTYREQKVQRLIEKKTLELTTVEERWDMALRGAEIGVFDIDLITGKSVVSDTWKRLMNVSLDDPSIDTQKEFLKKIHAEDLPHMQAADTACINKTTDRSVSEYRIETHPNVYRWMKSDAAVVSRDHEDKALRLVGSQTDVTNLHEARASLRASIDSFQALFAHAPVGMALINEKATIIKANNSLCGFLGYSESNLIGKRYWDIMVPEETHKIVDTIQSLQSGDRKTYQNEHQFIGKSGQTLWGLTSVSLDKDPTTGRDLYITQIQDINQAKEMEKIKNEFVATVSHELRTPLTSVKGALGLLQATMTGPIPETTERLLSIANSNCNRLTLLVNDILDMEKFATGNFDINLAQEDLKAILVAAVDHMEPYAKESHVSIKLEMPSGDVNVWTDSKRVDQVMANLLSNAAKFSDNGSEILIACEQITGAVRISVHNHGPGISEDYKADIFKPFSQGDSSTTREKGGTGLGLNISKQIVEQLGGEIGFESIVNLDTTFWFTLPLEQPPKPTRFPRT